MEEFIAMLESIKPGIDYANEEALWDDHLWVSIDVITIVAEIASKYGVKIESDDLIPDNFNSAQALYELVEELR